MKSRRTITHTHWLSLSLCVVFLGQACSKDEKTADPPVIGKGGAAGAAATGGASTKGGATASGGGGASSSGGNDSGGVGTTGGSGDVEGGAPTGSGGTTTVGTGGQTAEGGAPTDPSCFERPKTSAGDLQFLNRCTDSRCSPFNNSLRIPGYTGTLPTL